MKIFIETERLILREIEPADEPGLFELDSNPAVHTYLGKNPVKDVAQIRDVIHLIRQQYLDNGIGRWAIIHKATNEFIGWSGLKLVKEKTNHHIHYYDLGYRLIEKYWGKGLATESARAILQYAFETLHLTEIYSMCEIENKASAHVLEKSGLKLIENFTSDGIEHYWYKITVDNWNHKNTQL